MILKNCRLYYLYNPLVLDIIKITIIIHSSRVLKTCSNVPRQSYSITSGVAHMFNFCKNSGLKKRGEKGSGKPPIEHFQCYYTSQLVTMLFIWYILSSILTSQPCFCLSLCLTHTKAQILIKLKEYTIIIITSFCIEKAKASAFLI